MPGATFDALLRHAARAASRRGVVGTGFGALAAALVTTLGWSAVDQAAAKNKKRKKKKKCAKSGQKPKKKTKKRCCKGLGKDATGRCATPCDVCASGCAFTSVQAAVDAAAPGATLTLCAGTITGIIEIAKNLTLVGTGDGAGAGNTILDGANAGTVLEIEAGSTVTLQNLRITGGNTGGEGGGIVNAGTLTLTDCAVIGNTTDGGDGGGIANFGTLELINSTVSGNTADDSGGGVLNGGTVELIDSSVTANAAGSAAGGINNFGTVICSGSTVSGNTRGDPPVPSNCIDAISGAAGCATCPD